MTGNVLSHEKDLKPSERRAIAALLSEPTIKRAADAAGVSESTIRRYLAKPPFRDAYETASRGALGAAMQQLHEGMGVAVQTLIEIAADPNAKPADRIRASNSIVDLGLRGREFHSFPERLAHLEKKWEPPEGAALTPMQEMDKWVKENSDPSLLYP